MLDIGLVLNEKSEYHAAEQYLSNALRQLAQPSANFTENQIKLYIAQCYYGLANCKRELGLLEDAALQFEIAQQTAATLPHDAEGLSSINYLIARNLGLTYLEMQAYEEARQSFSEALSIATADPAQVARIPAVQSYHGFTLVLTSNTEQEARFGLDQLALARLRYPHEQEGVSLDWAAHRFLMGNAYEAYGQPMWAWTEYLEALRLRLHLLDPQKIGIVYCNNRLGDTCFALSRIQFQLEPDAPSWQLSFDSARLYYEAIHAERKLARLMQWRDEIAYSILPPTPSVASPLLTQGLHRRASSAPVSPAPPPPPFCPFNM